MAENAFKVNHSTNILQNRVWSVRWHYAGHILASCGDDKTVKLWKVFKDGPILNLSAQLDYAHDRTIRCVAFSSSGRYLATAGFDALVIVYRATSDNYEEMTRLEGHQSEVKCCAFSACDQYLATCSRDKTVWIWRMDDDEDFELSSVMDSHSQDVKFVLWHPFDELLVSCGYDCSIKFYCNGDDEWVTQQSIAKAHDSTVWAADFAGSGDYLVTVGADHFIKIWCRQVKISVMSDNWILCIQLEINTLWPLYSVSWNKISGNIVVAGGDKKLRFYEFDRSLNEPNLREVGDDYISESEVNCVAWNPTMANLLAFCGDDGLVQILSIAS